MVLMYKFEYSPKFRTDIKKLDKKTASQVYDKIKEIKKDPIRFKHLGGKGNCDSVRVGPRRIIYSIIDNEVLFVVCGLRKDVYIEYRKRLSLVREELVEYGINNS